MSLRLKGVGSLEEKSLGMEKRPVLVPFVPSSARSGSGPFRKSIGLDLGLE